MFAAWCFALTFWQTAHLAVNDLSMDVSVYVNCPVNSVIWNICGEHYICQSNDCWLLSCCVPKSLRVYRNKKKEEKIWHVIYEWQTFTCDLLTRWKSRTVKKQRAGTIGCPGDAATTTKSRHRTRIYCRPFFGKYFAKIYYKNINVSTTNHFTLVDKAIYICTRKLSHRHVGQS